MIDDGIEAEIYFLQGFLVGNERWGVLELNQFENILFLHLELTVEEHYVWPGDNFI